jgi:uncharacterized protein (DUF1778 family)
MTEGTAKPRRKARDPQYRLTLMVTSEELSLIEAAARAARRDVGAWCLRAILEAAKRRTEFDGPR